MTAVVSRRRTVLRGAGLARDREHHDRRRRRVRGRHRSAQRAVGVERADVAAEVPEGAAGSERHIAVSAMPAVDPLSCREIEHLQPRLLVLHCSNLVDPGIRDLLLSQRCNVLVVR